MAMAPRQVRLGLPVLQVLPVLVATLCASLAVVQCVPAEMASPAAPGDAAAAPTQPSAAAPAVPAGADTLAAAASSPASQNIPEFFPQINGDLTKVSWAHAVNSKALLEEGLNGTVLMLEADVILGVTPGSSQEMPVMGHPPDNSSDLSLNEFLRTVVTHNHDNPNHRKGVKLDFKSIEVFEKAIDELRMTFNGVPSFPVWLNADILRGPVNATATPVDAARFLSKSKAEFPDLMLSLGWTTRWGSGLDGQVVPEGQGVYTEDDVKAMEKVLSDSGVTQPITYAVRAAFVANSLDTLQELLKSTAGTATLTVWMSDAKDELNVKALRDNILKIGTSRVYVDVPADVAKELDLAGSSSIAPTASWLSVMFAGLVLLCGSR